MEVPGQRAVMLRCRRAIDHDFGAPDHTVPAIVGIGQPSIPDLERPDRAAVLILVAADIEHVAKVGVDANRALDVDGLVAAVLNANPLVPAPINETAAANAQALLRHPALAFNEEKHGIDQLKGGDVALVNGC